MFVDKTDIFVKGGRGGDGCVAFRREKYIPFGGPAGGDGGHGGSVTLRATDRVSTLIDISRRVFYRAENGKPGRGKNQTGKSGQDLVVEVPRGTIVRRRDSGEAVRDLVLPGEELAIARGGRGGRGNKSYAHALNQVPREFTPGGEGEEGWYTLELKLIADVGLVGLPNAGKSTLLGRVSAARPKVAPYPFTTLAPVPGIVSLGEYRSCVIADLPGLIEGASRGVGLGDEFLRHVERCRFLVHLLDIAPLPPAPSPAEAYRQIRQELVAYGHGVAEKPEIVAANKVDLLEDAGPALRALRDELGGEVEAYPISAVRGDGIRELLGAVARMLESTAPSVSPAETAESAVQPPETTVQPPESTAPPPNV